MIATAEQGCLVQIGRRLPPALQRVCRRSAIGLASILLLLAFGAGSASAGDGTLSASCNNNIQYPSNPHVYIDSGRLRPLPGWSSQYVATNDYLYSDSTGRYAWGGWNYYWATNDPGQYVSPGVTPDFWLGAGWYAAGTYALVWNGAAWYGPTTNTYIQFPGGGWWCYGL